MLNSIFTTTRLDIGPVLICMGVAVVLGLLSALIYHKTNRCSSSFAVALAMMPLVACAVILVVNGNLGAGIAVAGSFSLVRFRSAQGSAREIIAVFHAMALGLCLGAGYVAVACLLFALYTLVSLLLRALRFGEGGDMERELKISVPEALDYENMFDDLLSHSFRRWSLERVRTMEMGSVYQLVYHVTLPAGFQSRPLLDEIRTRNGNLPVALGRVAHEPESI